MFYIYYINWEYCRHNNSTCNNKCIYQINYDFRKINFDLIMASNIMSGMMMNAWVCQSNSSVLLENNEALFDKKREETTI